MQIVVDTLGALFLSGAGSLLAMSLPAAAYVWRKTPRRRAASTDLAVLLNEIEHIQRDIAEIKQELKQLRPR